MSKPETVQVWFEISKRVVWEAYEKVKANEGAAGVDGESIAEFERDLKGNLYKLWNRMSRGRISAAGACGGDTEGSRQGCPRARGESEGKENNKEESAHGVGPDRPDGRAVVSGAGGGTTVPSRLYGYRPGRSALDRGGDIPATMLEEGLGDRPRHPGLLRQLGP